MKNRQSFLVASYVAFSLSCGADVGPDAPQLTTYIHDPYIITQLDEVSRCPSGSNPEADFVVFNAAVDRVKASTDELEPIPQAFSVIGLYVPEHMHAIPHSGQYGLLLDYTADLQLATTAPSDSVLSDLSPEDQHALLESCGVSISAGTIRVKMGPLGYTLTRKSNFYCTPTYLGPETCWHEDDVFAFLVQDPWRGPRENYDRF